MVAKNDITGDSIQTKVNSNEYMEGYQRIFGMSKLELRLWQERFEAALADDVVEIPDDIDTPEKFANWIKEYDANV